MASPTLEKARSPLSRTTLLTALMVSVTMILAACQSPPPQPTEGQSESSTATPIEQSSEQTPAEERSSATANADGSPIVFDPVDAGKHLPDPCLELPEEVFREVGLVGDPQRETIGLDDELLGKGISCNFGFIDKYEGVALVGVDSDTVSKEHLKRNGFFIRDAPESIVPNAYFYTYAPNREDNCSIGAHTLRGRLGVGITGEMPWAQDEFCAEALRYFDEFYQITNGFQWLGY
ncbi:DUF3558 family protein [Corynebacterium sp. CCM 9185]|uniref:DUF3558 family protein n=1 Tax=Corynebacterium marambiense TaxID=2765364 RepID=A0ABS0VW81_9CORY|nr:DUF3558 family protein [Corynebacterium marambiense]MBI9001005.1 DUF3558 family protein [Corynebacterium marambiense]MCK7662724.1 DUF3558 family protein [Corynebacterium marambiense]